MTTAVLQVDGVSKSFGAHRVTRNISLTLAPGSRTGLIGPNGSGKTTLINLLTGTLRLDAGSIHLNGEAIDRLPADRRVRRGLVRTHQINTLLSESSVRENVALAISERRRWSWRMVAYRSKWRRCLEEAEEQLAQLGLAHLADRTAAAIPYGSQRLLELAIALALEPSVLLLDEPAAGVSASEIPLIERALGALPPEVPILLIDHDIRLVFRFAQEVIVLVDGSIIKRGRPAEVVADPAVRAAYLGRAAA